MNTCSRVCTKNMELLTDKDQRRAQIRCFVKRCDEKGINSSSLDGKHKSVLADLFGEDPRTEIPSGFKGAAPGTTLWALKYLQGLENQQEAKRDQIFQRS